MTHEAIPLLRSIVFWGAMAAAAPAMAAPATAAPPAAPATEPPTHDEIVVTARRLDGARAAIQPSIGANQTRLDRQVLDIRPGGADRALNAVLLQVPGVAKDTDDGDAIHIRNEHAGIQYRLNGVMVPDTIAGFGPLVDTRIADSVEVLTGALPAQYGDRTAGVVSLTTRSGAFDADGDIGIYGGGNGTIQPSVTWRNSLGKFNVFASASYLRSDLGLASPTPARDAIHDRTGQFRGFAYLSYLIDDESRLTAFGGSTVSHFQIPNTPGQPALFAFDGQSTFDSAGLDQNQRQQTHYGVLAYQVSSGSWNVQVAPYVMWARARFTPDPAGGQLYFNGFDGQVTQTNLAYGLQADTSVRLGARHTLRFGLLAQQERNVTHSLNRAFPVSDDPTLSPGDPGYQLSDTPRVIAVDERGRATTLGFYAQDEWKLSDALTLNFGLRYDRFRSRVTEDQLSPRAGLVWKPDDATTVHVGYARNFSPPPLALIGFGDAEAFVGTAAAVSVPRADPARAEREHQFDTGVQRRLGALTLALGGYYKIKRNLLDATQFGATELLAPFNYATGTAWGVELSGKYARGPLQAYINLARGDEKGRRIVSNQYFFEADEFAYVNDHAIRTDHTQKWTISGGASLRLADGIGQLQPSVEMIYGSGLPRTAGTPDAVPNGETQEGYLVINLGLAQEIGQRDDHRVTLRIDVINLFDRTYLAHDGAGIGGGQPQYGPRRAVMFGLRKSF